MKTSYSGIPVLILNAIVLGCLPAMLCASAEAALVERDWQSPSDAALTYDTDTGLEWLDLTVTQGMSYNDVAPLLATGQIYEGFQFASDARIIGLFSAVDLVETESNRSTEGYKVELLLNYWGVLYDFGDGERSEFYTIHTAGLPQGQHWTGRVVWLEAGNVGVTAKYTGRDNDFASFTTGSALIRPAVAVTVDGDVNRDGVTDLGDFIITRQLVLGQPAVPGIEPGHADYFPPGSPDGIIDASDLAIFLEVLI